MVSAAAAKLVLIDATVPHRFCDAGLLPQLVQYLRNNTQITPEVESEIRRSAHGNRYAGLRLLERVGWPGTTGVLPPPLRAEFEHLRRAAQQPGDSPDKHTGEIATVLTAQDASADLVIIDDELGKRLAKKMGLVRMSTAQLALEMVVAESLTEVEGLALFNVASNNAGEKIYRSRLQERKSLTP